MTERNAKYILIIFVCIFFIVLFLSFNNDTYVMPDGFTIKYSPSRQKYIWCFPSGIQYGAMYQSKFKAIESCVQWYECTRQRQNPDDWQRINHAL